MRPTAIFVVLVLLASAQCIWACTLADCSKMQQAATSPCHEHKTPAPVQHSTHDQACDHQKIADQARTAMPDLQFVATITAAPEPVAFPAPALAPAPMMFFRPPPLIEVSTSVLRI